MGWTRQERRRWATDAYNPVDGRWERIAVTASARGILNATRTVIDRTEPPRPGTWFIGPAWYDIQVNGLGPIDFNDAGLTPDGISRAVRLLAEGGVTRFCPTLVTGPFDRTRHLLRVWARAAAMDPAIDRALVGLHLEGPYISAENGPRGAHNADEVRDPNWSEWAAWQKAADGRIRIVTLAPERRGAVPFIRRVTRSGVVAALGHHAAGSRDIALAVDAGARLVTHFGNGAHPLLPRHPNYLWDQLAHPSLFLSVIGDGHHLPPSVLQVVFRCKPHETILISDQVAVGDPGASTPTTALGQPVQLDGERLGLRDQPGLLAGATTPLSTGLARTSQAVGHMRAVLAAVTTTPARLLGLPPENVARDWVVFHVRKDLVRVRLVVQGNQVVYRARGLAASRNQE